MGCKHHRGREHGPLLDLTPEPEDSVLLEAFPDVENILVLERNESHLLKTPQTRLLYELHHRLRRRRGGRKSRKKEAEKEEGDKVEEFRLYTVDSSAFPFNLIHSRKEEGRVWRGKYQCSVVQSADNKIVELITSIAMTHKLTHTHGQKTVNLTDMVK